MKVIVVMPAYNAEKTLGKTYRDLPLKIIDEVILVDDASSDKTVEVARRLGLTVVVHSRNQGYGANQKTCYEFALRKGADIVIMIHPDYQYDARLTPYIIGPIKDGIYDVMLGSRIRSRRDTLEGGMPVYKYIANRFLTFVENIILGQNLSEYHTGFRAYRREVLETIPYQRNSNSFTFDAQFLIQACYFGFKTGELPVPTRYFSEASSTNFFQSVGYGLGIMVTLLKYLLHKGGLKKSRLFLSTDYTDLHSAAKPQPNVETTDEHG